MNTTIKNFSISLEDLSVRDTQRAALDSATLSDFMPDDYQYLISAGEIDGDDYACAEGTFSIEQVFSDVSSKETDDDCYEYNQLSTLDANGLASFMSEEGIDIDAYQTALGFKTRKRQEVISQERLNNFNDLSDCFDNAEDIYDSHKHAVIKVYANGDKLVANEQGNFIINATDEVDTPNWLRRSEAKQKAINFSNDYSRLEKYLYMKLNETKTAKKKLLDAADKLKGTKRGAELKAKGIDALHEFEKVSKLLDEYHAQQKKDLDRLARRHNSELLHLYCIFTKYCNDDKVLQNFTRDDVVRIRKQKGGYKLAKEKLMAGIEWALRQAGLTLKDVFNEKHFTCEECEEIAES